MAKNKQEIEISAKDKTKGAFRSVNKGLKSVTDSVFSTTAAIGALVGVAGFGALIKSSLAAGDALAKTADKLGITTEALGGLQHAAELTGVSSDKLDNSLQRLTRGLSEVADKGTGSAAKALDTLGLSATDLIKIPVEEQMHQIADAMALLPNQADKVRVSFELFGREGVDLVNTLGNGSAALIEMTDEAAALGVALSRVDAAKMEAVNDAFFRAGQAVTGVANKLTAELAPFIEAVANEFVDAAKEMGGLQDAIVNGIEKSVKALGIMANGFRGLQIIFKGIELAFTFFVQHLLNGLNVIVKGVDNLISWIPGVGKQFESAAGIIDLMSHEAAASVAILGDEMRNLALDALPSEAITEKFNAIRAAAEINAVAIAERAELNRSHELAAQLDHNRQIVEADNEKTRALVSNRKKELSDLEKFNALSWDNQVKQVSGSLVKMTQGVTENSKKLFNLNKAAGIANAIINTAQGVTNALAAYPPPLSFGMAAAQLAAGIAQVNAIKNTSFGGGSVPSLGGTGTGAAPIGTMPVQDAPGQDLPLDQNRTVTINLQGSTRYSKDEVRDLIDQINVEIGDGAELVTA